MLTLGVDTCEARGSIALWREGVLASLQRHETPEDYSSWLLPAVEKSLRIIGEDLESIDLFGVATGPGSFTGLRVGITAVKAWSELYAKPVASVSRLEVMARTFLSAEGYVTACFDAQRGQIFGGLYRVVGHGALSLVGQEMVIGAEEFVRWVGETVGESRTHWVTLDPQLVSSTVAWQGRVERGEMLTECGAGLAAGVAQLAENCARQGALTDALHLDANYVRRSDAEIFWKDPANDAR